MSQSTVWDPAQYSRYGDLRLRPALELFSRISIETPSLVHDIGTGGGEIARLMAQRWPDARVIGSDSSREMRPILTQLPADDAAAFSVLCRRALRAAYPAEPDGTTLFPFHRLFIVARR